jgi:hypothetical protein
MNLMMYFFDFYLVALQTSVRTFKIIIYAQNINLLHILYQNLKAMAGLVILLLKGLKKCAPR